MRGSRTCTSWLIRVTGYISFSLAASLLFVSGVSALDYSWSSSYSSGSFPDASSACAAGYSQLNASGPNKPYVFISAIRDDNATYYCRGTSTGTNGQTTNPGDLFVVYRSGNACPAGSTYDPSTGMCKGPEPDKCASTAGSSVTHESDVGPVNNGSPGGDPDPVVCSGSCQYVNSWDEQNCYMFAGNDPAKRDHFYCKFRYQGNGTSCTAGNSTTPPSGTPFDQPATKPPISLEPSTNSSKKCGEWTTTGDGSATRNCDTDVSYTDPGKLDCKPTSTKTCTPISPIPELNDNSSKDTTTSVTNPDGSKTTTTVTTNTKVTCKGVSPCTTTTSTTTKTDNTNADGTAGDSTTTCKGSGCKPNGTGSGNGDDATDNDGDEGEEEEESSVGGEACTAAISCNGDAIQCAILRQEKLSQCNDEKYRELDVVKLKSDVEADFSGVDFKPLVAEAGDKFNFANVINTDSQFSASCPRLPTVQFSFGTRTETIGFDEGIDELCKYAILLSYLMVAFAMYRAAGIIAGGMN